MKLKINRQGFCMADDSLNHVVEIEVESQQKLETFIRDYLPLTGSEPCLWAICCAHSDGRDDVVFYFYRHNTLAYFIDALKPYAIKDGDYLCCRIFLPKWVESNNDIPKDGDFIYRIQQYLEGGTADPQLDSNNMDYE